MWDIKEDTEYYNADNSDLSLFNCIKRSTFVGSDDAVETFKRHTENEQSATQTWRPSGADPQCTIQEGTRWVLQMLKNDQMSASWKV